MTAYTYTTSRALFGTITNNSQASNLTFGDTFINQYTLELVHKFPGIFTEQTFTSLQTYPSQQYYSLPANIRRLGTVVINVGNSIATPGAGFNWPVTEIPTRQKWNELNLTNNITSDIPQGWFFYNGQLGIYPKPATGYNPITITAQVEVTSLSVADITSTISAIPYVLTTTTPFLGTETSCTLTATWTLPTGTYEINLSSGERRLALFSNASTAVTWTQALTQAATTSIFVRTSSSGDIVTGSGTSWSKSLQGYVFNLPTGDNMWYFIDTVYDTTHLSLKSPYGGTAFSTGTPSATIGQTSLIPFAYQTIPIFRAAELYYTVVSIDKVRADKYKTLADESERAMRIDYGNKSTDPTLQDVEQPVINPNLAVNLTGSSTSQ